MIAMLTTSTTTMTSPATPPRREPITLPHLLAGRYELRRLLGSGGMGDVYAGIDVLLHRDVAIKLLRRADGAGADEVARFHAEALALASLSSSHVVAIHDFGFADEGLYTVMGLVAGRALDAILAEDGALPVRRALRIARHVLSGLIELHRHGLVHGDVKPGNVIIERGDRAVLIDLGVAADLRTGRGIGGGTPPYMAPEAARGERIDARADLFAAGILLVEALSGAAVTDHADCARRAASLPPPLAEIATIAIDPEPEHRFRDARAMRDALHDAPAALRLIGIDPTHPIAVPIVPGAPVRVTVRSRRSKPVA
jgi:serine/threonine-protein kinase